MNWLLILFLEVSRFKNCWLKGDYIVVIEWNWKLFLWWGFWWIDICGKLWIYEWFKLDYYVILMKLVIN